MSKASNYFILWVAASMLLGLTTSKSTDSISTQALCYVGSLIVVGLLTLLAYLSDHDNGLLTEKVRNLERKMNLLEENLENIWRHDLQQSAKAQNAYILVDRTRSHIFSRLSPVAILSQVKRGKDMFYLVSISSGIQVGVNRLTDNEHVVLEENVEITAGSIVYLKSRPKKDAREFTQGEPTFHDWGITYSVDDLV